MSKIMNSVILALSAAVIFQLGSCAILEHGLNVLPNLSWTTLLGLGT